MKCIGDKCPTWFESDGRASCKCYSYVDKTYDCTIDIFVNSAYNEFMNLETVSEIVRENQL